MGVRDGPPALPAVRSSLLGRHTTSTPTGKSVVTPHARRCRPVETLTSSGRPMFVSRLQPCHAQRLGQPFQRHHPPRRRPLLPATITGGSTRSLLTPRQPPSTSFVYWTIPDPSSSSSLLPATLPLEARGATPGASRLAKVELFQHGVLCNVDESRGLDLADPAVTN